MHRAPLLCNQQLLTVPWSPFNYGLNYIKIASSFNFRITHIFRENNACVDKFVTFEVPGLWLYLVGSLPIYSHR